MPKKIPEIVKCNSNDTLERELKNIYDSLVLEETEETWDKISYSIYYLVALSKGGACDFPSTLIPYLKLQSRPLNNALNSERSRLSGAVTDLIAAVSAGLGQSFDPLIPIFIPTLLGLATRSNKLFIARAKSAILSIVENTLLPSLLPHLRRAVADKSASLRLVATDAIYSCLNCFNPPDLEQISRAEDIEAVIRCTVRDANADVRKSSRKVFEAYKILLPGRVDAFVAPLTPKMKKYLDIKGHFPKSASSSTISTTTINHMTSSLPPALSSTSTAFSQPKLGHTRSASSTAVRDNDKFVRDKRPVSRAAMVAADLETVSGGRTGRKDNAKHDMGPPMHIPEKNHNKMPSTSMSWGPNVTSNPTHRVPILRPVPNMDATKPQTTRPPVNAGSNEQAASSSVSNNNASTARSGAQRPQLNGAMPPPLNNSFKGPIRPQALQSNANSTALPQETNEKVQVTGGARRAPRPPLPPLPPQVQVQAQAQAQAQVPADAVKKSAKQDVSQKEERERPESRGPAKEAKAHTRSKSVQPSQRIEKEKEKEKEKTKAAAAASKPEICEMEQKVNKAHAKPTAQSDSKLNTNGVNAPAEQEAKKARPPRSLTAPTLSQLAKIKEKSTTANTNSQHAKKKLPGGVEVKGTRPLNVNKKGAAKVAVKNVERPDDHVVQKAFAVPDEKDEISSSKEKVEDKTEDLSNPEDVPLPESPKLTPSLTNEQNDNIPIYLAPELVFTNTYDSPPRSQLTDQHSLNADVLSGPGGIAATPISSLVLSIRKGFDFTPFPLDDNSHSGESIEIDVDTTLPFPQDEDNIAVKEGERENGIREARRIVVEEEDEDELDGLEFCMDGIGADGRVIASPRKKRDVLNETSKGSKDINYSSVGRNVFAPINI